MTSTNSIWVDGAWWSAVFAGVGICVTAALAWIAAKQQTRALRLSWTGNVVDWAQCCVRTLSEIDHLCFSHGKDECFEKNRHRLLHLLSSLIDEGRFFFANRPHGDYGLEKPMAYRGLSPKLLDCLKLAYHLTLVKGDGKVEMAAIRNQLFEIRRDFVSEVQGEIDPRWIRQALDYPRPKAV